MPKNIFFMSFLYVFIACTLFIAATVRSAPLGEDMVSAGTVGRELQAPCLIDAATRLFLDHLLPACSNRR